MESKAFAGVEIKNAEKGQVEAVFSTFNVIDKDGDVTLPGAFEDGAPVRISAYGHRSWMGELPVGKGTIQVGEQDARLVGQFFLDTDPGKQAFLTVKNMGELQEWSYGFDPVETESGTHEDQDVRFLKKLKVHEVSPVLVGAGENTRTLAVKGRQGELPLQFTVRIENDDGTTATVEAKEHEEEEQEQNDHAYQDVALKELGRFEATRARLLLHG